MVAAVQSFGLLIRAAAQSKQADTARTVTDRYQSLHKDRRQRDLTALALDFKLTAGLIVEDFRHRKNEAHRIPSWYEVMQGLEPQLHGLGLSCTV